MKIKAGEHDIPYPESLSLQLGWLQNSLNQAIGDLKRSPVQGYAQLQIVLGRLLSFGNWCKEHQLWEIKEVQNLIQEFEMRVVITSANLVNPGTSNGVREYCELIERTRPALVEMGKAIIKISKEVFDE